VWLVSRVGAIQNNRQQQQQQQQLKAFDSAALMCGNAALTCMMQKNMHAGMLLKHLVSYYAVQPFLTTHNLLVRLVV
jgi:hypothetical protein